MYVYARQFDKALEVFNDILKLDPSFHPALNFRGNVYCYRGMEEEAKRDMTHAVISTPDFEKCSTLAYVNGWFGHREEALKYLGMAEKVAPSRSRFLRCGLRSGPYWETRRILQVGRLGAGLEDAPAPRHPIRVVV